jgi:hypothetical protein
MVSRIRTNAPGNPGHEQDKSNASTFLSSNRSRTTDKDELIVSLAERYENRRARQVGEWERLYGQNVYRAF